MTEPKNIDDIVVAEMQRGNPTPQPMTPAPVETPPVEHIAVEHAEESKPDQIKNDNENIEVEEKSQPESKSNQETSKIDEYGNPLAPPKLYTPEEVQAMIRDRLSRGKHAEMPQQPETQTLPPEQNSEEWEQHLEQFIDRTVEKRERARLERQWKETEAQKQAEFESRFLTGVQKYNDFESVVAGKPITKDMMMAARNLENPAAFVYGAAKLHPQELNRISQIPDPYAQAIEVGRLHERMVKESKLASNVRPIDAPKGDVPFKQKNMPSLEERINEYAKQKRK